MKPGDIVICSNNNMNGWTPPRLKIGSIWTVVDSILREVGSNERNFLLLKDETGYSEHYPSYLFIKLDVFREFQLRQLGI